MTIGEKIREARLAAGLTQKQLGDMVGIADSAIRKYESGKIRPKISTVRKIADAIGCNVTDLDDDIAIAVRDAINSLDPELLKSMANVYSAAQSMMKAEYGTTDKYEALKVAFSRLIDSLDECDKESAFCVVSEFQKLNSDGKSVAADCVKQIARMPCYKATAPEDTIAPPAGESDGKETTEE